MNAESLFIILIFFKLSFSNSFYSVPILKRAIISRNYTQKREISRKASEISNVYIKDYDSMEYYGILSCGTPKKEYSVIFDSGSSDVWLESITCTNCGGQNFYDPNDSTTYESTSSSFSITYGSGKVSGIVGIDDFSVGDLNITGLKFGLAETEATAIASLKYLDGIVGLAFSSLAEFTLPTFLTLLDGQNDGDDDDADDNNMFSVYFDTSELQQSMITFRGYDSSLLQMYNQTWKVIPLVQSTVYAYWSISMDGLYVSSSSVYSSYAESVSTATAVVCQTSSCIAIVDTGTSTIALSTSIYASVLASVTDGKNCNDDAVCFHTSVSEFPVLLFSFNTENVFPLLPARYVKCTGSTCVVYISNSGSARYSVLGVVFLEEYFTLFQVDDKYVAFACGEACSTSYNSSSGLDITDDFPSEASESASNKPKLISWLKGMSREEYLIGMAAIAICTILFMILHLHLRCRCRGADKEARSVGGKYERDEYSALLLEDDDRLPYGTFNQNSVVL